MRASFGISMHSKTCLLAPIIGLPGLICPAGGVAFDGLPAAGLALAGLPGLPAPAAALPQAASPSTRLAAIPPRAARLTALPALPSVTIAASFLRHRTRQGAVRVPSLAPGPDAGRAWAGRPCGGGPPVGRPRGPGGLALLPMPAMGVVVGLARLPGPARTSFDGPRRHPVPLVSRSVAEPGAERAGQPGDRLSRGRAADLPGEPGAGEARRDDVRAGGDRGQAVLDVAERGTRS